MSYYRSYFSKNNTIIYNSLTNTSKNPTTDIFYGDGYSKFIFQIDLTDLSSRTDPNTGDLVINTGTSHVLHMTNTIFGSESLIGQAKMSGGLRATSFDLILYPITEFWDEGVGFDYENNDDIMISDDKSYDNRPSNWYYRTGLTPWASPGINETIPSGTTIYRKHFDNGNENIDIDITDYINNILSGNTINYGMALSFDYPFYSVDSGKQDVSFFSKYTQSFYEPYLETYFDDTIIDDRDSFVNEINQNLYLYVSKNGNFIDLDTLPTVDILNSENNPIIPLTGITSQRVRKGVYKITIGLSGEICNGKKFYYDNWTNLKINGVLLNNVRQRFIPTSYNELFEIGSDITDSNNFIIKYSGIKLNEKIKRSEKRKIIVSLISFNQSKNFLSDELYYRIYVKEGKLQVNVFGWTKIDKTYENSFILDTSYLIPREYFIEIKSKINSQEIFYDDQIKFEIVNEK